MLSWAQMPWMLSLSGSTFKGVLRHSSSLGSEHEWMKMNVRYLPIWDISTFCRGLEWRQQSLSLYLQFSSTSLGQVLTLPAIKSDPYYKNNIMVLSDTKTKQTSTVEGTGQKFRWSRNLAFDKDIMTARKFTPACLPLSWVRPARKLRQNHHWEHHQHQQRRSSRFRL